MCWPWEIKCNVEDVASGVMGDALDNMAAAVQEAVGYVIGSVGTMWVNIGTPNLTEGDSTVPVDENPPFSEPVLELLGYITWISFAIAVVSIITLGAMMTLRSRRGEGILSVGRLGLIIGGVILISASSGLVTALLPAGPSGAGGTVAFLQGSLWWLMLAVAAGGVVVGGARMAIQQRAQPGKDLAISLLQLIVIAGAGVTFVGVLVRAMDSFSIWLINTSLACDVGDDTANCFGENMTLLLALSAGGPFLIIVLGLIALLCALGQIILMIARGGMLVVLTGILPLSASAATTGEAGKGWLNKNLAWLIAFILYKPAAAVIYAAAFQLAGTDLYSDDADGLLSMLTGVMMMVLALFALPALMRFVTPMVGSMAAGAGGGAMAAGAMAALPQGAASMGRMFNSGGGNSGGGGNTSSKTGTTSSPDGADTTGGTKGSTSGGGTAGPTGNKGGGSTAGDATKGAATATKGAGTGAAASTGGGAATGAGAAAGPVGMGVTAGVTAAKQGADAAKGAAEDLGNDATGDPSGS